MGQAVVRGGFDTHVDSARPAAELYGSARLRLVSGQSRGLVYFKVPAPRGSTVTSAVLRYAAAGASTGARTLTATRVAASWKVRTTNWNNQPGVTGAGVTATVGDLVDGQLIEWDVTSHAQAIVNGAPNYGWRITTNASTAHRLHGLDAAVNKPTLEVTWSDAPDAPTTLTPADGVVSVSHPTVAFDYTDVSGSTELAAAQVQVDPAANAATPAFDSGEVATVIPEVPLAGTAYAGLADGVSTWWRVRVKDADGLWSTWSDWARITRHGKPAVTITNPAAGTAPFVSEPTPPIMWTCPGQTAWQVRVTPSTDRGRVLHDSGKRGGTATAHTLPVGVLADGETYTVTVRCWDRTDRVTSPGDPTYASAERDFVLADDPTTNPVDTLTAAQQAGTPWVDLVWTRSTAPDTWTILRDGRILEAGVAAGDLFDAGTTYRWTDYGAGPYREHTYRVKPVVTGRQSEPGPAAVLTTEVTGVWLVDTELGVYVVLAGDDGGSWETADDATTYTPVGSTRTVRVVTGMRGLEGSLTGLLVDGMAGRGFAEQEADLYAIKERPARTVRLVTGDVNFAALVGDITVAPTPRTRRGQLVKDVSLSFWQVGDLPYDPRL